MSNSDKPKVTFRNLSVLAYANGFTLWHYRTTHSLPEILNTDYFHDAETHLAVNDMVLVNARGNSALCIVVHNDGTALVKLH